MCVCERERERKREIKQIHYAASLCIKTDRARRDKHFNKEQYKDGGRPF